MSLLFNDYVLEIFIGILLVTWRGIVDESCYQVILFYHFYGLFMIKCLSNQLYFLYLILIILFLKMIFLEKIFLTLLEWWNQYYCIDNFWIILFVQFSNHLNKLINNLTRTYEEKHRVPNYHFCALLFIVPCIL